MPEEILWQPPDTTALERPFRLLCDAITELYKAMGNKRAECGHRYNTNTPPCTLDIEYVPQAAEPVLVRLAQESGVPMHRNQWHDNFNRDQPAGFRNESGYYCLPVETLTPENLANFRHRVEQEIARLGHDSTLYTLSSQFDAHCADKPPGEQLEFLHAFLSRVENIPPKTKADLVRIVGYRLPKSDEGQGRG